MTEELVTHPRDLSLLLKLLPYTLRSLPLYIAAVLVAPLAAGITVLQPYLLKVAIDEYIASGDVGGTRWIALIYLACVLGSFALEALYSIALGYAAMRTIAEVREAVYTHTLSLKRAFFDVQPAGKLLTRATSDVEALGETLTAGAVTIVLDVVQVTAILIAMFLLDPWLTLVMMVMAPVIAIVIDRLRRVLRGLYALVRTSLSDLNSYTSERLTGLEVVQLYSDEERTLREYRRRLGTYRDATIRTNIYDAGLYAIIDGLGTVTMALMLWYGSGGLFEGTAVTAGLLAAFIDYIARLYRPLQEFSSKVAVIQRATAALEKIFGLLDLEATITPGSQVLSEPEGKIRLRGVSFAYGDGPRILDHIDLDLDPGDVVAIVGRTGSGKTTLGKLLTRSYDGYTGSITVDGVELTELTPASVRRNIATVQQDVQLFPGDVRFNLAMGRDLTDEQLWRAIHLARADQAVDALGGLDGRIDHGGLNLSVGEAQLLSFARTLAADPPIVILDEATANVDTLTEEKVQQATEVLLQDKTVLVIAHRLSTIVGADRIAVMDAGRIVEIGPHEELLARNGAYADLYRQRMAEQTAEADSAQTA